MRVVALASGGKDSCFSILKVVAHGHRVVALAHIAPPQDDAEADSWMYQSVGSSALPLLAEALDIPLFSRRTCAVAKARDLAYAPVSGDEVEDLVDLLRDVKKAMPNVQAVCAGALWSDYQRLRVESAASRVGLLSLAPLWRREQRGLLAEMISVGLDAVLIKVAGVGLSSKHLGNTLAKMQPTLEKLEELYGSHVCGEGGEYESLVLNMPSFQKRLVLDNVQVVLHEDSEIAPVAYLQIKSCHLEKQQPVSGTDLPCLIPTVPDQLLPLHEHSDLQDVFLTDEARTKRTKYERPISPEPPSTIFTLTGDYAHIACLSKLSGAEGVMNAATGLQKKLKEEGLCLGDILYVWLSLESVEGMAYAEANRAYCNIFGVAECIPPPSRACVAMPNGEYAVSIEAIARRDRRRSLGDSRTLHVQSLSEWAPPCIGPYAQVVEDNAITYVSGALAMHAPNASLIQGTGARAQTRGCLFNIKRTLEATRTRFEQLTFFVAYSVSPRFFSAIHEEFYRSVENKDVILAVVPCEGLPKDALVEVRAIGSYSAESEGNFSFTSEESCALLTFQVRNCDDFAKVYAVRHGSLVFAKIFVSSSGTSDHVANQFVDMLVATEKKSGKLLSSQVYVDADDYDAICTTSEKTIDHQLYFITSAWMPGDARILGIMTFECGNVA